MDPKLEKYLKEHCGPNSHGEQDENGVDLSLIRENLKLSLRDRLRKADFAAQRFLKLRENVKTAAERQHKQSLNREI